LNKKFQSQVAFGKIANAKILAQFISTILAILYTFLLLNSKALREKEENKELK